MTQVRDFWSRRKAAVKAEAEAEVVAAEEQAIAAQHAELEEKSDAELLAEFDLPDPETLQPGDDVSGFMAKAVPDRLRRRALRRLWRLNPVLANVDGLVDYGEDYTDAACVIENLQTAYQVGKGMLAHVEALAAAEDPPEDEFALEDEPTPDPVTNAEPPSDTPPVQEAVLAETEAETEVEDEIEMPPAPRRMRFEFEG
ncbi:MULTISPECIES: DUF3306 domain-containing protein [unclassified Ruegeria]|uniref:DUF3306 domain-containing protein n=1 Tax=unclassified Ruegeria TaxID=2625375 RepID=UPI0014895934|nr:MULTISPECIES: DUF3306 domain-containing protein [unclassified Ruegeria]NOD75144.1 DUF3306 domain-containing protein [Ruegeria sp. HKCCD4332]NOD87105.1 DUF3306 domain-containing protein [Ruegeria sp. HKCCD4318]NOE12660.1 DUF3306 domain-containing protein [Ruegeria sp. HKCCD4318-2]NOG09175.1 DUF3306 domain-containing protein [Ruegeria sp. HKCCD4315]